MIPIYICEDNNTYLKQIVAEINTYILIQNYDMEIVAATAKPYEILDAINDSSQNSIYFLDVDLQDESMNGFQLGQAIRKIDTRGFIVFVTTHSELLLETFRYRLEAMDYIYKDDMQNAQKRIRECLDSIQERILLQQNETKEYLTIKIFNEIYNIPLNDLLYLETSSQQHRLIAHTSTEQLEFFGSLQDFEKTLSDSFIRVHRSFLVSKKKIYSINLKKSTLTLDNGQECLIARNKKKLLKDLELGKD